MMGFDPVVAFNMLLERLDKLIAVLEQIAVELAKSQEKE